MIRDLSKAFFTLKSRSNNSLYFKGRFVDFVDRNCSSKTHFERKSNSQRFHGILDSAKWISSHQCEQVNLRKVIEIRECQFFINLESKGVTL